MGMQSVMRTVPGGRVEFGLEDQGVLAGTGAAVATMVAVPAGGGQLPEAVATVAQQAGEARRASRSGAGRASRSTRSLPTMAAVCRSPMTA